MRSLIFCALMLVLPLKNYAQTVSLFAGTGASGYSGDGMPATAATLTTQNGIALDAANNLYIADMVAARIRKVDAITHIISTVAGDGTAAFFGDGGPATAARLYGPQQINFDPAGNLYIADEGNNRIRKINTSGVISTIAGNHLVGLGGMNGPATAATLNSTWGVAEKSGYIYLSARDNYRVFKIDPLGIIKIIGGNGVAGYTADGIAAVSTSMSTYEIAVDNIGNVYVSDAISRVRKIDTFGIITTVAGTSTSGNSGDGGPATAAELNGPRGLFIDAGQNLYIADQHNYRVRKVTPSGIISTVVSSGIGRPVGVVADNMGNFYVSDQMANKVWYVGMPTYPPSFTGGASQTLSVCESSGATPINALLAVDDASPGRTLTWSMVSGPAHGSAIVGYTTTSTGSTVTPTGLSYTPTTGYSGADVFTVQVTDGTTTVTTTINVAVVTVPSAGTITGLSDVCVGATINLTNAVAGGIWSADNATATVSSGGVVTGVSAGNNEISYSVTNACGAAVATHSITISSPPSVGTISGPSTVCVGSSIMLSNTAGSGTWSSSGVFATISSSGIVTGVATGIEIITYTVTNACGSASVTVNINVNTGPSAGAISGPSVVCEGAVISLSGTVAGGAWSSSNTNATVSGSGVVSGNSAGTSIISYTITSACGSTSATHNITINPLPFAGAITGASAVCVGSSINLSNAAPSGVWTSSSANASVSGTGLVTGIASGTATISYSVTNSCGTDVATHAITIDTPPSAGIITGPGTVCVGASVILSDGVPGGSWSSSGAFATVSGSGVVTGVATGAETISYTVTNACGSATATANMNVTAAPSPGAISGPSSVCEGAAITLSETTTGGVWSSDNANATITGSGTVTGVTAGTATISYTLTSSCGVIAAVYPITIMSLPVAGTITGAGTVCVANSITLASTAGGGAWSASNANASVTSGGVVTGVAVGAVTIIYTVTNTCGAATATFPMTVVPASDCTTGSSITTGTVSAILDVYPNPNKGVFTINISSVASSEAIIVITNVLGEKVRQFPITANMATEVIFDEIPGVYFISATVGSRTYYKKILVAH